MNGAEKLNIVQFLLVYLLLLIVLVIMKKSKINQTKLLFVGSLRMTLQLVLAGFILTFIFKNPHPAFTVGYVLLMTAFAIFRVLSKNKSINSNFKKSVAFSISFSGVSVLIFFIIVVVNQNIFNPQYTIPLAGMIIGNSMTGVGLGLKTFNESLKKDRIRIEALQNLGVTPKKILLPYVNSSLETALLPTLNTMVGMGVVSLPGMMTGQILSGTLPTTAIMYQISIMIAICTAVCISVYCSLNFGYHTLYNDKCQIKL